MAAPQLFNPSIIPTICDGNPQAINRLAQQTRQALQQLAQGNGSVFRFALTDTLSAGGSAPATIQQFDTSGFVSIGSGTVYDEEPGGFWAGAAGDEGWCTGRNGAPGSYSIIFMELSMQTKIEEIILDDVGSTIAPPTIVQAVQIWKESGTPVEGDLFAANASGYLTGKLYGSGDAVWVRAIDFDDSDAGAVAGEHARYVIGFENGTATVSAVTRPLYLCQFGEQTFLAKPPTGGVTKGSSGDYSLYHKATEADSGLTRNAKAKGDDTPEGKWCFVQRVRDGQWYAVPYEPSLKIYRGLTDAQINKGSSGTVSRYTDGTDTDSTVNDTVINGIASVGSGKVVIYLLLGGNYYLLQSEKTSVTVLEDMRVKADNTEIEAQGQTVWVDPDGTASWSDKVPLGSCS